MSSAAEVVAGWLAAEQLASRSETVDAAISIYPVLHSGAQHFQHITDGELPKTDHKIRPQTSSQDLQEKQ